MGEQDLGYRAGGKDYRAGTPRESNSTGWFVGIIIALAILAICAVIFSANSKPVSVGVPAIPAPASAAASSSSAG